MSDPDDILDRQRHGDSPWRDRLITRAKEVVIRARASGTPAPPNSGPYRVVAVLGQSNAYGSGLGLDRAGLDAPDPRVHQWPSAGRRKGTILLGGEPLLHDVPGKRVGFGSTFASLLAADGGDRVLLVPYARGDTSFAPKNGFTWDADDTRTRVNLYRRAVRQIDSALATDPGNILTAILWHQGESDVPLLDAAVYRTKLDRLLTLLRERYGPVPVILGGMVPEEMAVGHRKYPAINAVHVDTPNRRPLCAFVPGPAGMTNSTEDRHYSAAGQRELGRRMFEAFRALA